MKHTISHGMHCNTCVLRWSTLFHSSKATFKQFLNSDPKPGKHKLYKDFNKCSNFTMLPKTKQKLQKEEYFKKLIVAQVVKKT
jgi:hypothetical protein